MDEGQKDMDEEQKCMDDGKKDIDEGHLDMDKDHKDMDEGEKEVDEAQKDMDMGQKEMYEKQKEMDEEQKEMNEGQKEMDEEQKEMDEKQKEMDEGQKEMDEEQKEMDEVQKEMNEGQKEMDEEQNDMDERQKEMDDRQTTLAVISEEDSPSLVQHAPEGLTEDQASHRHVTLEQLRQRQQEDQQEMEQASCRREERRRAREEEEQRLGDEEEQHRQKHEEEERSRVAEGIERRRASAERRLKNLSISSCEGDESFSHFSPMSPTFKNEVEERMTSENTCTLNERTESLNRSLQKSNSIKKTEPPLLISKIDDRLEQYTHAIETSSKEVKAAKQQVLMDLPSPTEPVAAKKNLFEAGEAWTQTQKGTPSKDTEGLKVGVADLIHQWVKGTPDGSCKSPSMPAEVKAGDVLSKKNLWENLGDSTSPGREGKGASGKKYKFVMMAHGKYEKVAVGEDDG